MRKTTAAVLAALGIAAAALPHTAAAQVDDAWRFQAILYGYLPDIGGKSTFPERTGGSSISLDSDTILDALKMTFMGTFEAKKGRWGFMTDILYMDLGGSKSGIRDISIDGHPLPVDVSADVTLDIKGTIWLVAGTYGLVSDPASTVDLVFGARMLDYQQRLGWEFSADLPNQPSRSGTSELDKKFWDGIVGVKGRFAFGAGREWFVPYYFDVGTGDSDLTWQAIGGIGYSFKWGDVIGGWRYIDYKFKSGSAFEDATFNGPMVGVAFRW